METLKVRATDKQIAFLTRLAAERIIPDSLLTPTPVVFDTLSKAEASRAIETLLAQPRAISGVSAEIESGMYQTSAGDIFKVYQGQSGRMLAKRLTRDSEGFMFEYAGAAYRFVKGAKRMTLEDAKAFGAIYGVCCNCGATLTDENSIAAGIGPVCATKF